MFCPPRTLIFIVQFVIIQYNSLLFNLLISCCPACTSSVSSIKCVIIATMLSIKAPSVVQLCTDCIMFLSFLCLLMALFMFDLCILYQFHFCIYPSFVIIFIVYLFVNHWVPSNTRYAFLTGILVSFV